MDATPHSTTMDSVPDATSKGRSRPQQTAHEEEERPDSAIGQKTGSDGNVGAFRKSTWPFVNFAEGDWETLKNLSMKYGLVMEEAQIVNLATFQSIRQTASGACATMFILLIVGTTVVRHFAHDTLAQSILLCLYTVTSAGFGSVSIPYTSGFLMFNTAFLFVGITTTAILFAQVFQYAKFEAARYQHAKDKAVNALKGLRKLESMNLVDHSEGSIDYQIRSQLISALKEVRQPNTKGWNPKNFVAWLSRNQWASALSIFSFMFVLLLIGTVVLIHTEGWTPAQALYFSVYAMSTVGYGDLVPQTNAGTWFVDCWLPFNVIFFALYLSSVAHYYIMLSTWNVQRMERVLTLQELNSSKDKADVTYRGDVKSHDSLNDADCVDHKSDAENAGNSPADSDVVQRNVKSVTKGGETTEEFDLTSLFRSQQKQDGTRARQESKLTFGEDIEQGGMAVSVDSTWQLLQVLGIKDSMNASISRSDDSDNIELIVRFCVLERLVMIIASLVNKAEPGMIRINGSDASLTIDPLKETAEEWLIPPRARQAFRMAYFKGIVFVGEQAILSGGASAFLDLNPFDFSDLFCPFVVALDDLTTMRDWLDLTADLASKSGLNPSPSSSIQVNPRKRVIQNKIDGYFPLNTGNAIVSQI